MRSQEHFKAIPGDFRSYQCLSESQGLLRRVSRVSGGSKGSQGRFSESQIDPEGLMEIQRVSGEFERSQVVSGRFRGFQLAPGVPENPEGLS